MHADVVIAGAGPAGSIAAVVLARAGVGVLVLDRATFPRGKLCGDTLNPGAVHVLQRLRLPAADRGLPIRGMVVTGVGGVRVCARYPDGVAGRALARHAFDQSLLEAAATAGARVEDGVLVQRPILAARRGRVQGVVVGSRSGGERAVHARLVIAADGRESRLARSLALARHPVRPRRWAVGVYFRGVRGMSDCGEMHVRPAYYIGVAPLPDDVTNVCVVTADRARLADPPRLVAAALAGEPELHERFRLAEQVSRPLVLGPLALESSGCGVPGLLLAGDSAGFIDPMTGDGLRFAMRGGELAALEALRCLETGVFDAHRRLARRRAREFRGKWRVNRLLRSVAGSGRGIVLASHATRLFPAPLRRIVSYAGDVPAA
jgi:geranylgeranyl reductase family protein